MKYIKEYNQHNLSLPREISYGEYTSSCIDIIGHKKHTELNSYEINKIQNILGVTYLIFRGTEAYNLFTKNSDYHHIYIQKLEDEYYLINIRLERLSGFSLDYWNLADQFEELENYLNIIKDGKLTEINPNYYDLSDDW